MIITPSGNLYKVASNSGKTYLVKPGSCTCPHHQYREVTCKHMEAVEAWREANEVAEMVEVTIRVPRESLEDLNRSLFGV